MRIQANALKSSDLAGGLTVKLSWPCSDDSDVVRDFFSGVFLSADFIDGEVILRILKRERNHVKNISNAALIVFIVQISYFILKLALSKNISKPAIITINFN